MKPDWVKFLDVFFGANFYKYSNSKKLCNKNDEKNKYENVD